MANEKRPPAIAKATEIKSDAGGMGLEVRIVLPVAIPSTAEELRAEGASEVDITQSEAASAAAIDKAKAENQSNGGI
jgi:hypothetical protein